MIKLIVLDEVALLLAEIQAKIRQDGLLFINGRSKNAQTLARLGIIAQRQRAIIDSLLPEDYCGGPDPDEKYPWKTVTVFGKQFGEWELYIKFSMGVSGTPVVCISFHEAERPMTYQFK